MELLFNNRASTVVWDENAIALGETRNSNFCRLKRSLKKNSVKKSRGTKLVTTFAVMIMTINSNQQYFMSVQ
jgi:hypothetical protein